MKDLCLASDDVDATRDLPRDQPCVGVEASKLTTHIDDRVVG